MAAESALTEQICAPEQATHILIPTERQGKRLAAATLLILHCRNHLKSRDTNINKSCISIQIQLFHFIEIVYIGGEEGINLKHNS